MRRLSSALPAVVAAALALTAVPAQVRSAFDRLRESPAGLARDAEAARRALHGDAYAGVVEEMLRRVPPNGSYAIADDATGNVTHSVRCDLAPRSPVLLRRGRCGSGWFADRAFARVPDLAVLVSVEGVPRVVETRSVLAKLWSGLTGPQEDVPGWIDEPAEGSTAAARVTVGGWCQERGGRPCAAVRVWVDDVEVEAVRVARFPRPDVEAAVPGIGDCSRAGWRVDFDPGALAPGRHCVAAALVAEDGRHRRLGPWAFTVAK